VPPLYRYSSFFFSLPRFSCLFSFSDLLFFFLASFLVSFDLAITILLQNQKPNILENRGLRRVQPAGRRCSPALSRIGFYHTPKPDYFKTFPGRKEISPVVSKGAKATKLRTGLIEKVSASFPVRGVNIPPVPKARPIMRLATMDLPLGASSCAITTPSGRVARTRNPDTKAQG